ncbi:MAG: recombinase family protein [Paracoccaceae bacterium]|jgi:DNA invertase Pin-like site-specific DNA recombinase
MKMAAQQGPGRPKVLIGYVRVSTEGQGKSRVSLDLQRDAIREFAAKLGVPLLEIFEDVASGRGAKSFPSRQGLQRALEAVRDHGGDLVVWDWSRLSRHADHSTEILGLLTDEGRIHSISEAIDLAAAAKAGQLVHAQRSGEVIAKRTKDAMAKLKASGTVFGNPDILDAQRKGASSMSAKSDALVSDIADALRSIPDQEKLSRAEIAESLNARGIATGASLPWNVSRVTGPLRKARSLLKAEAEAAARAHPKYGLF